MFMNNTCIINVYIISNFNSILFTHYSTLLLDLHFIYLNQFLLFIYYNFYFNTFHRSLGTLFPATVLPLSVNALF